ncbi:MAG: PriCT-2 domain-containing protein [Magnetococcales bacterium]|nr:PriCT-2 domain-containing protein [Magnetococcales bacterium]
MCLNLSGVGLGGWGSGRSAIGHTRIVLNGVTLVVRLVQSAFGPWQYLSGSTRIPRQNWRTRLSQSRKWTSFLHHYESVFTLSSGGTAYSQEDARDVWRSIKPGGGITSKTLFRMAQDVGWR